MNPLLDAWTEVKDSKNGAVLNGGEFARPQAVVGLSGVVGRVGVRGPDVARKAVASPFHEVAANLINFDNGLALSVMTCHDSAYRGIFHWGFLWWVVGMPLYLLKNWPTLV